jgi:hypothetical protein
MELLDAGLLMLGLVTAFYPCGSRVQLNMGSTGWQMMKGRGGIRAMEGRKKYPICPESVLLCRNDPMLVKRTKDSREEQIDFHLRKTSQPSKGEVRDLMHRSVRASWFASLHIIPLNGDWCKMERALEVTG